MPQSSFSRHQLGQQAISLLLIVVGLQLVGAVISALPMLDRVRLPGISISTSSVVWTAVEATMIAALALRGSRLIETTGIVYPGAVPFRNAARSALALGIVLLGYHAFADLPAVFGGGRLFQAYDITFLVLSISALAFCVLALWPHFDRLGTTIGTSVGFPWFPYSSGR